MTNSPTPEGAQEATDGRESASTAESEAQGVQPATDAAERRTAVPGHARLRALAVDAVGPVLNKHGAWLPLSVRQAVADAVLAAVEPVTEHCVHDAAIHHRHHQPRNPVIGCPWCEDAGTRVDEITPTGEQL